MKIIVTKKVIPLDSYKMEVKFVIVSDDNDKVTKNLLLDEKSEKFLDTLQITFTDKKEAEKWINNKIAWAKIRYQLLLAARYSDFSREYIVAVNGAEIRVKQCAGESGMFGVFLYVENPEVNLFWSSNKKRYFSASFGNFVSREKAERWRDRKIIEAKNEAKKRYKSNFDIAVEVYEN